MFNATGITMQRPGEQSFTITLEDAVVIMQNQQRTIDDLIKNNQRMYQYIQEMQSSGGVGPSNYQFSQQNVPDPATVLNRGGGGAEYDRPITLNEYLASKNAAASKPATGASSSTPMTLDQYLAAKKAEKEGKTSKEEKNKESKKTEEKTADKPMTLNEFLEAKKKAENKVVVECSSSDSDDSDESDDSDDENDKTPVFNQTSKSEPEVNV